MTPDERKAVKVAQVQIDRALCEVEISGETYHRLQLARNVLMRDVDGLLPPEFGGPRPPLSAFNEYGHPIGFDPILGATPGPRRNG